MTVWAEKAPSDPGDEIGRILISLSERLPEKVNVGDALRTVGEILEDAGSVVNQGEQMTAEELKELSDNYNSDLMDSIFEETEE